MVNNIIKSRAMQFINREIERVLRDLECGVINKDQAIGSLNTVFNISSGIEDVVTMKMICTIIAQVRSATTYFQITKLYVNPFYDEITQQAEDKKLVSS